MISNYLKLTWKVLLRHPFYTFITLFGITLTLTVLMVLTSFVDHLLGSHYPENKRYRSLYMTKVQLFDSTRSSRSMGPASFRFAEKYVKSLKTPETVSVSSLFGFTNAYANGKRIKLNTKFSDAEFWQVTDFEFLEGKPYNAQEIQRGDRVVVITDYVKKHYFENDDQSVIGKNIEIENVNYRIVGVVKGSPATRIYTYADVFFPYTAAKSNYQNTGMRGSYIAIILARDRKDFPIIQNEYNRTIAKIPLPITFYDQKYWEIDTHANSYTDDFLNILPIGDSAGRKFAFYSIVGMIVLMFMGLPAINLVNVNVSRMMERASEIGVRKAFGAPSRSLLGQFIVENIFITFIGGAIALVLAFVIIKIINSAGWFAYADLTINWTVFAVSLLVCLIFGLLSGFLPALRMSKLKIAEALKY